MSTAPSPATASPPGTAPLAYFWGDDAYGLEAALDGFRNDAGRFPDGPPATALELNGWGDDLVHDYLKAIEIDGRLAVLYSNKDYGCEWDYDFRNKRFLAEDNTKFGINIVMQAMLG